MDPWKFESNPVKQTGLSLLSIAVGVILVFGFRHFDGLAFTISLAGFLLGLILLLIGVAAFLARGKQTIVVDPRLRQIVVEDTNLYRKSKKVIPFNDITDTGIAYVGKKSNLVAFYYINLKLKNGESYPLFAPGRFFGGASDRSIMESRRQRLDQYIKMVTGE